MEKCPLCERQKQPEGQFCSFHAIALKNLEKAYLDWSAAYDGVLTRGQYFTRLMELNDTGAAVKDVIRLLRGREAGK